MARGSEDGDVAGVVIVEDTVVFAKTLVDAVQRARGPDGERAGVLAVLGHDEALAKPPPYWTGAACVLLDAYDHARQRTDPAASRFAGLEVAAMLPPSLRVVGYSADIARPEVNIPFRECSSVAAFYDPASLLDFVASALWDEQPVGQAPAPTPEDRADLGVGPDARVCDALRLMRSRPDAWELVARTMPHLGVAPRTREFVNDRVKPLLGIDDPSYKPAVRVLQRVTALPASS